MDPNRNRRRFTSRKRPRLVLGGIAVASIGLSGCGQEPEVTDARFTTVSECTKAGYPSDLCQSSYSAALSEHQQSAPAFQTRDECREEWGENSCQQVYRPTGSVFIPALAGFVLGRMAQRDYMRYGSANYYGGGYYGTPIYRNRGGGTVTVGRGTGGTITKTPVNVNTTTVARSGFGGRGFSRGGFGG
ncbi:hypothetical protein GCM10011371_30840 [Novosphingobium marinum]|uniref:Uncharacterized protein YgiB involved in biofilm formation n=1 Tax=Novosphingobium marinum TaxID=1514948 RepID=A0A7Y9XXK7_9SPHN|nr:DUF1190 domain-containing protein [Novosphingobium marinum]NYH94963.1 uncharacterized protein YgiB involved in biofilm formation [Novosphingobium marinum]GGC41245.1 hypothetical protein GCM10011371_30840 [Novosphingobium marinum]